MDDKRSSKPRTPKPPKPMGMLLQDPTLLDSEGEYLHSDYEYTAEPPDWGTGGMFALSGVVGALATAFGSVRPYISLTVVRWRATRGINGGLV